MFGQMTAGLVDLHRFAGDPPGHVPDVRGRRAEALRTSSLCRPHHVDCGPRWHGRRPAAGGNAGRRGVPVRRGRSLRGSSGGSRPATSTRRPSRSTTRSRESAPPPLRAARSRSGLLGNAADVVPELARRGEQFDLVTDQTAAHDPLTGYVPQGLSVDEAAVLRSSDPDEYLRRARTSIAAHVEGLLDYVRAGSHVFDYGNNLRGEALEAGVADAFAYPGFVPAYIRPLFCRGNRAVSLGGPVRRPGRHQRDRPGHCASSSRTTSCCSGGSSWRRNESRSRDFRPASAGSVSATGRAPGSRSTSWSGAVRSRRRS